MVNVERDVPFNNLLIDAVSFEATAPNIIKIPIQFAPVADFITISGAAANNGTYTVVSLSYLVFGETWVTVLEPVTTSTGVGTIYTSGVHAYALKRGTYDTTTGLLSPDTVFNLEDMTVSQLIRNHGNWIRSMMYGFDGKELAFQTTEKNKLLYTQQGALINDFDANIQINQLDAPLFIPKYLEVEVKVPVDLTSVLEDNPAKCFSFTWQGDTYKGFLIKAGISISDNAQQVFKLLSSPDNDFSRLV